MVSVVVQRGVGNPNQIEYNCMNIDYLIHGYTW